MAEHFGLDIAVYDGGLLKNMSHCLKPSTKNTKLENASPMERSL